MKINIEEMKFENIDYSKIKPFQGNLKILSESNYKKLSKSFKEKGLFVPMFVWKKDNEYLLLDGHGRERFFEKEKPVFIDRNGKETKEIPCVVIQAKNEKDAKQKLLLITSQFQTITQEGFDEFSFDLDENWLKETVNFDLIFKDVNLIDEEKTEIAKEDSTQFLICVECDDEFSQKVLFEEFQGRGLNCKIIM